jgi:signal transduction histidine kinase
MTVAGKDGLLDLKEAIEAYNGLAERLTESQRALQGEVLRLRTELAEKNRQLARKNRLEVLGEMAAGVAHEIRNPLGGIELYAGLIEREASTDEKISRWAGQIHRATRGLASIVGDILDFTRPIAPRFKDASLTRAAGAAVEMAAAAIAEHSIEVAGLAGAPEAVVRGDGNLLSRAFLNIVLNAVDAMPDGGTLTISVVPGEMDEVNGWTVSFCDTGSGIDEADLDNVFDPFFTAKEGGTGLGLAMVSRIVEAHDGRLSASNGANGGAVFSVTIPAADNAKGESE